MYTHTHTHACTHIHTRMYTHARTHAHTHTHTHLYAYMCQGDLVLLKENMQSKIGIHTCIHTTHMHLCVCEDDARK